MALTYHLAMDTLIAPDDLIRQIVAGTGVPMTRDIEIDVAVAGDRYYGGLTALFAVDAHRYPLSTQRRRYPFRENLPITPSVQMTFRPYVHDDLDGVLAAIITGLMSVIKVDPGDFIFERDDHLLITRVLGRVTLLQHDPNKPWLLGPKSRGAVDVEYSLAALL